MPSWPSRVPVVARPVGVKGAEQALRRDHLGDPLKRAHRAFLLDEEGRIGLGAGIVHGDDQVPPLPRHPLMGRSILVQHHAGQRPAGALAPMRPPAPGFADTAMGLQRQADPVVAALESVLRNKLVPEMLGREIEVLGVELLQDLDHRVHRNPARRNLAQAAVVKTFRPVGIITVPPAPERPLAHPQNLRCLHLAQLTPVRPTVNLLELHQS